MASSIPSMPPASSSTISTSNANNANSTTNNRPLSLSSSSLSPPSSAPMNLFNNNLNASPSEKSSGSRSLNFTTKTNSSDKIKNAHHLQQQLQLQLQQQQREYHQLQSQQQQPQYRHPHEDQSNPINFSANAAAAAAAAAKLFSPFGGGTSPQQLFAQHQQNLAAAGLHYNSFAAAAASASAGPPPNLRRDRRARKTSNATAAATARSSRKPSNEDMHHNSNLFGSFHERFMNNRIGTVGPAFKELDRQIMESEIPIERQLNSTPSPLPVEAEELNEKYEHLKWDDHVGSTVSAIQSLLQNETFVDVTLVCDIEEIDDNKDEHQTQENDSTECNGGIHAKSSLVENEMTKEKNNNKVDKISKSRCNDGSTGCKNTADDSPSPDIAAADELKSPASAETKKTVESESESKPHELEQPESQSQQKSKPPATGSHTKFKAHKIILSTCSEYFRRIFSENPCKHPVLVLKDFQPWEVRSMLDFMYTGQIILKPEHLETLHKTADALQIRGLKEVIEKSQEWKQRKVTSSSSVSSPCTIQNNKHSTRTKSSVNSDDDEQMEDEKPVKIKTRPSKTNDDYSDEDCEPRLTRAAVASKFRRRESNDSSKHVQMRMRLKSKSTSQSHKLGTHNHNHELKKSLEYDGDEDDEGEDYENEIRRRQRHARGRGQGHDDEDDNNVNGDHSEEVEDEDGHLSPKLLNLSMSTGTSASAGQTSTPHHLSFTPYDIRAHHEGLLLRSSLSITPAGRRTNGSGGGIGEGTTEAMDDSPALANEPQTAGERERELVTGDSFPRSLHNHFGQTNPSASPPFPRRKQARPRRRSGDFVAQDLRTSTPLSGVSGNGSGCSGEGDGDGDDGDADGRSSPPYQRQHLFPSAHDDIVDLQMQRRRQAHVHAAANNEVLDFTVGNNNNHSSKAKRDGGGVNERGLPMPMSMSMPMPMQMPMQLQTSGVSQVNNFIANHFLKTWSSSTSGGSRTDSPTVQSPHHHHQLTTASSSPFKRELDSEDLLLSPPVDNYHSRPGTPDTASPPLSEISKPVLRRRRDRLAHRRRPNNSQHRFNPMGAEIGGRGLPSPNAHANYFHALNNGHLPPHPSHHFGGSHLGSGHNSDPETSLNNPHGSTPSPSTPPKSFSPIGFPMSLSSGAGGLHQNASQAGSWPGLPLGPPPIFGRHRAQHSAPRGGPPRAWSNADLTEALHNVWNKKMTTSQASRIFGIPYNSLLMYVRGKYGKSLKLDVLKKGLDQAMLEKANNNHSSSGTSSGGGAAGNGAGRSSTPSSNNNNNNSSNKSKSHSATTGVVDSPPLSLNINSLMGGDREQQSSNNAHGNMSSSAEGGGSASSAAAVSHTHSISNNNHNHNHSSRNDPQDIMPSGFNPFSIFGEYPQPFPFSNAAAAAAALSHILPPPHSAAANHLGIGGGGAAAAAERHAHAHANEKGNKSHPSSRHYHHHHRRNSSSGDIDK